MQREAGIVVVLGTGGTIAGVAPSASDDLAYRSAQLGVAELVTSAPGSHGVRVESEQVAQLDSKDMDFATWRALALRIEHHASRAAVRGIVVTHGTDTLEETAYFLSRVVAVGKPVVLTAAMRPATSAEADGPRNLADAIVVAASSGWHGIVVVIAGEVHAAGAVRKVHPRRLDAFSSGEAGPLARIAGEEIDVLRAAAAEGDPVGVAALPEDDSAWPWVEIVSSVAGADGRIVDALSQAGIDGIVVAASGNGTVHGRLIEALGRAHESGVAILRSTRCLDGSIVSLGDDAFASAGALTPVKARIELLLRLLAKRA